MVARHQQIGNDTYTKHIHLHAYNTGLQDKTYHTITSLRHTIISVSHTIISLRHQHRFGVGSVSVDLWRRVRARAGQPSQERSVLLGGRNGRAGEHNVGERFVRTGCRCSPTWLVACPKSPILMRLLCRKQFSGFRSLCTLATRAMLSTLFLECLSQYLLPTTLVSVAVTNRCVIPSSCMNLTASHSCLVSSAACKHGIERLPKTRGGRGSHTTR